MIGRRLKETGLEQRDLARAAQVTESYISQLLTRKKAPAAPDRTDLYDKLGKVLKFPHGELARLAGLGPGILTPIDIEGLVEYYWHSTASSANKSVPIPRHIKHSQTEASQ